MSAPRRLGENVVHEQAGLRCTDCRGLVEWPPTALKGANVRAHIAFLRLIQELHATCDPAERSESVLSLVVFESTRAVAGVA